MSALTEFIVNANLSGKIERTLLKVVEVITGGTVQTISGDSVDNTDPLNPVIGDSRPYKVFTAKLTQTGTSDPVVVVLENTFPTAPVIARSFTAGSYDVAMVGAYTANKTVALISQTGILTSQALTLLQSVDNIMIQTGTAAGVAADAILTNAFFEIRVYN